MVHSIKKTLLIATLAAAIAGCTTTPTAPPTTELPQPTLADIHLERWWTSFNEPPLTALIDEARRSGRCWQCSYCTQESPFRSTG